MSKLSGFLELLKAPLKIISQNGKIMAITASVYLILYSIFSILCVLSVNPVIYDLTLKIMDLASAQPGTPSFNEFLADIRIDTGIFFGIEAAYVVLFFFVAIFGQTAVIIIASCYYSGHDLSLKELVLKISKTWTRPFVTSLWVQLIALGYTYIFLLPFLVPSLILYDHRTILIIFLIILAIIFFTLNIYLSVVWSLGVVVSVVEDSCGFSALAKARELVKGKRVLGFLLSLLSSLVVIGIIMLIMASKLSLWMPIVAAVIQVLLIGVLSMFVSMAYTGFYFQCKNDMTKSGVSEYSRISTSAVVDEYVP